jgi:hypothetical protein
MRSFVDGSGQPWVASAREEDTPRHHGRWYLVFHPEGDASGVWPMPEVRWQTRASAERTLGAMSGFELVRRLDIVRGRSTAPSSVGAAAEPTPAPTSSR